jgi:alpha-1,2-mannosyltransferase
LLPFLNPPFAALLLLPFGLMPNDVSFILWDVVQFAILLISLWLLSPLLPGKSRYLLWLGAFAFLPVYQNLLEGQLSAILLLGITLFWRGMRMGAEVWGGAMLAFCLFKPQLLPLFIIYLLYKRAWRAIGGFVAGGIVIYLLSAAISGWAWPTSYINALLVSGNIGYGYEPSTMYNLIGLLDRLQLNYWLLIIATTLAVVGFLAYGWWHSDHLTKALSIRNQEDDLDMGIGTLELQLAVTTVAAALVSPHLYSHDLTILLFSGAVLLGWAARYGWPGWVFALFLFNLFIPPFTFYNGPISGVFVLLMILTFVAMTSLLIGSAPKEVTS